MQEISVLFLLCIAVAIWIANRLRGPAERKQEPTAAAAQHQLIDAGLGEPPPKAARAPRSQRQSPSPQPGRWRIAYQTMDDAGHLVATERYVRILAVKPRRMQLVCWCELRNAERTFSIFAIGRAVDAETGEIIDLDQWLAEYRKSRRRQKAN